MHGIYLCTFWFELAYYHPFIFTINRFCRIVQCLYHPHLSYHTYAFSLAPLLQLNLHMYWQEYDYAHFGCIFVKF